MLTIQGRATSSNVQAFKWLVGELKLPHQRLESGHAHGGLDDAAFLAINPHGPVPALEDGETRLFESGAILRYLAAEYASGSSFWPDAPRRRAEIDKWTEWAKTTLCTGFTEPIFWARVRTSKAARDEDALAQAVADFEGHFRALAAHLGPSPYIFGDEPTLADIVVGHLLFRYIDIDVQRDPPAQISSLYDAYARRRAYRRRVMVSYDALRAEGA